MSTKNHLETKIDHNSLKLSGDERRDHAQTFQMHTLKNVNSNN